MSDDTEILREIRDLLQLIAEPALAERNGKLRSLLLQIVGSSKQKADAIVLMDGTRAQSDIKKECGIDAGNLSRLVKALREGSLIGSEDRPRIVIPVPANFLDTFRGA